LIVAYAVRMRPGIAERVANRVAGLGYAIPGVVIAVGVMVPLTRVDHWIGTGKLLLSGTIVALLYAYLVRFLAVALQSVEAGLAKIRPSMDDAARSLGAGPGETLARVHAPLLGRSLIAAALLVFVDVMKELPATLALRPFDFDTLAVQTFNLAKDERLSEASIPALAIVLVGLIPVYLLARSMARR
jgi:iron(III) transport system permease protein